MCVFQGDFRPKFDKGQVCEDFQGGAILRGVLSERVPRTKVTLLDLVWVFEGLCGFSTVRVSKVRDIASTNSRPVLSIRAIFFGSFQNYNF